MKRLLFALSLAWLGVASANMAQAATIAVTAGSGTNILTKTDGSSANAYSMTLCDATNPDNCAPIDATKGLTIQGVSGGTVVPVGQGTAANLNATVIGAGSAGTANAGVLSVQGIASMTPVLMQPQAIATGGGLSYTLNSAATTNATLATTNAAHTLYELDVQNSASAKEYLILFDAASTPTCTGTPFATITVPAVASTGNTVGGVVINYGPVGKAFTNGIAFCMTTAIGGTGAVAANDLTLNITYK